MTLLDDVHYILAVEGREKKFRALRSAVWLFERNPNLPLAQQGEGIALLIAAYLHETDELTCSIFVQVIYRILCSRPYELGAQIDWETLTSALPHLPEEKVGMVLYLLSYAADERYLALLERYFDDVAHFYRAASSWTILAFTQHYAYDPQVLPFLQEALATIDKRFIEAERRLQKKFRRRNIMRKEFLRHEPWFRDANVWARQQLAEAEERIRQQVQLRPRGAAQSVAEENERRRTEAGYFPTLVQQHLSKPMSKENFHQLFRVRDTFELEGPSYRLPIDEVAQLVKVLMDYVLSTEDVLFPKASQSVHEVILQIIAMAFGVHHYVGTYLNWEVLEELLASVNEKRDGSHPQLMQQIFLLTIFSYGQDEHALEVLKPYLDHPDVSDVRRIAIDDIQSLLWHLSYYCPEFPPGIAEARKTVSDLEQLPETPEKWQQIKACLEQAEREARPYFHFYSI